MIEWRELQERVEGGVIPEGISVTETKAALYVRVRVGNQICTTRVEKYPLKIDYTDLRGPGIREEKEDL